VEEACKSVGQSAQTQWESMANYSNLQKNVSCRDTPRAKFRNWYLPKNAVLTYKLSDLCRSKLNM